MGNSESSIESQIESQQDQLFYQLQLSSLTSQNQDIKVDFSDYDNSFNQQNKYTTLSAKEYRQLCNNIYDVLIKKCRYCKDLFQYLQLKNIFPTKKDHKNKTALFKMLIVVNSCTCIWKPIFNLKKENKKKFKENQFIFDSFSKKTNCIIPYTKMFVENEKDQSKLNSYINQCKNSLIKFLWTACFTYLKLIQMDQPVYKCLNFIRQLTMLLGNACRRLEQTQAHHYKGKKSSLIHKKPKNKKQRIQNLQEYIKKLNKNNNIEISPKDLHQMIENILPWENQYENLNIFRSLPLPKQPNILGRYQKTPNQRQRKNIEINSKDLNLFIKELKQRNQQANLNNSQSLDPKQPKILGTDKKTSNRRQKNTVQTINKSMQRCNDLVILNQKFQAMKLQKSQKKNNQHNQQLESNQANVYNQFDINFEQQVNEFALDLQPSNQNYNNRKKYTFFNQEDVIPLPFIEKSEKIKDKRDQKKNKACSSPKRQARWLQCEKYIQSVFELSKSNQQNNFMISRSGQQSIEETARQNTRDIVTHRMQTQKSDKKALQRQQSQKNLTKGNLTGRQSPLINQLEKEQHDKNMNSYLDRIQQLQPYKQKKEQTNPNDQEE